MTNPDRDEKARKPRIMAKDKRNLVCKESVKTSTAWKEESRVICGLLNTTPHTHTHKHTKKKKKNDVAKEGTDVL